MRTEHRHRVYNILDVRHPILLILAIGIVLRLVLGAFSMTYDLDYWAIVMRNVESGNGLYTLEGYYYTPVWGYVLGSLSAFSSLALDLGETAQRVVEALFVEGVRANYTATVPSLVLLYYVKAPLFICDLITSFVAMRMAKETTGDDYKATIVFGLTFLSPILLASTGVIAMPDTMATMFAILTIYLVRKDAYLLAGMTFALAVLTKFFPAFLIFVLVAYIMCRYRDDRRFAYRCVAMSAVGAIVMTLVLFMPQILSGQMEMCFQFLTDRTGSATDDNIFQEILGRLRIIVYGIVLCASIYLGYRMYHGSYPDPFEKLMEYSLLIAFMVLIYPPTTQYMVILVPFLAYWIGVGRRKLMVYWGLLLVAVMFTVFESNTVTMLPLAVWTDLIGVDVLMDIFRAFDEPILGSISIRNMLYLVGGVFQCLCVLLVPYIMYGDRIKAWVSSRL